MTNIECTTCGDRRGERCTSADGKHSEIQPLDAAHYALGELYAQWGRRIEIACDRRRPAAERLAALHWIDRHTGEAPTPAGDLERVCDELDRAYDR